MKIRINIFQAKQWGEGMRQASFLGCGGIPPILPLGVTLLILMREIKKQCDLEYLNV